MVILTPEWLSLSLKGFLDFYRGELPALRQLLLSEFTATCMSLIIMGRGECNFTERVSQIVEADRSDFSPSCRPYW